MLDLYHNLMENLREIQELHPDAHFVCKTRTDIRGTEVFTTFKAGRFDAFVPMTCISEHDASFEEVNKLFCEDA